MTFVVRPSSPSDLEAIYEMAKLTGGGFTNLPPSRDALSAKLARSARSFAGEHPEAGEDLFLLVLENTETGQVRGTVQIFPRIGTHWPFYSYRLGTMSQTSRELGRTFRAETLSLVTDLEGCSEVGGLFLHPRERAGGLGLLLARSRYLFIRRHRARFADRILAELRGVIDEAGSSPFWDGIGAKFFGMSFQEADEFNAMNGNQFIADLMPKHPIYTAMLPDGARHVIGLPHPTGRPAMRMLEAEGFHYENYLDIFDGGPTMTAATDRVRTVRDAVEAPLVGIDGDGGERMLLAAGELESFRATYGPVVVRDGGVTLDRNTAAALAIEPGDLLLRIGR